MIYFILSLIVGINAAICVWIIFILEKTLNPNTLRRLEKIKRKSNLNTEYNPQDELDINTLDFEYNIKFFASILNEYTFVRKIKKMIKLADVKIPVDTFIFLSLICALPCLIFLLTPFKIFTLFSVLMLFVPTMYLKFLINKRFMDFAKQFPDALNLMASSLRAGHPLFAAIDIVTNEMPKPISDVFQTAQKDISLGIDTKDAFYNMTKIMPESIDLRFFITAVLIQKEVGGNLAELLDSLSNTIRERFKLLGQLRVQTAQTRLSGMIIGIVPLLILLALFIMNPEYIKPLFNTNDGQIALYSAIGLSVLGFILIKKISTIEM